jgi:hypothetical protein
MVDQAFWLIKKASARLPGNGYVANGKKSLRNRFHCDRMPSEKLIGEPYEQAKARSAQGFGV